MSSPKRLLSPFISVTEMDPNRPPVPLRALVLSDLQAVPQRIAQLSEWVTDNGFGFSIDLILVIGVSRPHKRTDIKHVDLAEQGNDSATIAELEQICPRVVYIPGLHESAPYWETHFPPSLTPRSVNAIAGPVHIASDLVVVHRRYADGITEKPAQQLPLAWKNTLYSKLARPTRYRLPHQSSAIVLCSSQLPTQGSSSKSRTLLKTVKSLLALSRQNIPDLHFILAIAPPKMQRIPTSSTLLKSAERTLDPGSFADGDFWIIDLQRPGVWDPLEEPEVDDDQLYYESAWEVVKTTKYNLEKRADAKSEEG